MGQSKATVPFLGEPLLTRIVERVACAADELVVTTNEASRLGFLGDLDIPVSFEARSRFVREARVSSRVGYGIWSGVPFACCRHCMRYGVRFAAIGDCEAAVAHSERVDAVVPCNKFGYEPFHAVYRTNSCLEATHEALSRGCFVQRTFSIW